MDRPIIDHAEVTDFVEARVNLAADKVKTYRDQVRRLRGRLDAHIEAHPGYALVKMLNAGSVAKGTALSRLNDMDVAVYVKAGSAPENEATLLRWLADRLKEAYPTLGGDQFEIKHHCVTVGFRGTGLDVDVVPVLYEGGADDRGFLIAKDTGDRLETSVKLHLDFIRSRRAGYGAGFTELIRILKWWADTIKRSDPTFRFKSFLIELIAAYLVDEGVVELADYPLALEQVFGYMVKTGLQDRIAFADYYGLNEVSARSADAIQVYDPVNPENNVARRYEVSDRDRIVARAQNGLDALTEAHYATAKGRAWDCWRDVLGPSFGR